ncbi:MULTISPECIES: IDEAL domain-containing protein [Peribacillus]|uniref:IDEAL domain-containing protein n=1 Tax=Peribacillus TaxID=2675229 RepID=UPI0009BD5116|nr:IDEAL domain-containing protein [Peribacillus simplex]
MEKQIDDSLKNRNKVEFFRLTNELKRTTLNANKQNLIKIITPNLILYLTR